MRHTFGKRNAFAAGFAFTLGVIVANIAGALIAAAVMRGVMYLVA